MDDVLGDAEMHRAGVHQRFNLERREFGVLRVGERQLGPDDAHRSFGSRRLHRI